MFYKDSSNNRYYLGTPFTYNGVSYGPTSATHTEFTALGFSQVTVAARPDDRFYIVTGPNDSGAYTSTARTLADLKTQFKLETKKLAHHFLTLTDWYVIRLIDGGFTDAASQIPSDVATYRAAIRTVSNTRCTAIDAAGSVAALETLITTAEGASGGLTAWPTLANAANYYQFG